MAFGRREFMKAAAGLASLAAAGRLIAADEADKAGQTADTARPNIILFLSDDHGYADSGVYGDTVVRTPNIDKLAAESMRFTQAYAASPLCVPSRCVIQTGRMPFSNGAHAFGTGMKPDVKMMPDYFRELGYYTAHVGKWHHGDGKQPVYDFKHASDRKALEILANHDKAKPLLLIICSHQPHLPWAKNESISTPPAKQTVTAGRSARFTVTAAGDPPLSYQWKKNGVNIPGATAASLASPGRKTTTLGMARSIASCSIGWWVGPSSPTPMESWVPR